MKGFFDEIAKYERKIVCRFANKEDLDIFSKINKLHLTKNTTMVDFTTSEIFEKKCKKDVDIKGFFNEKPKDWKLKWRNMPEYISNKQIPYAKIIFIFSSFEQAQQILLQKISKKTLSVWYPKLKQGKNAKLRVLGGAKQGKYPIYVVSKSRPTNCYTSKYLTNMEVYHYVVVEPKDFDDYQKNVSNKYAKILVLDMRYKEDYDTFDDLGNTKSKGPGAARNFCWQDSINKGYKMHWVMDDNATEGFHCLNDNKKIKCRTGAIFKACEDFVERFSNVAISGLNYTKFCAENEKLPPYVINTRIYSFLLIRNDIPYRWRGRYNEDTDICLRALKDGWCTIQFNAFLAGKSTTQKIKGGNTEAFYAEEGTYPKSKMLQDMHPDVAKVVWRFHRWHHYVNYHIFKQQLKLIKEQQKGINNYGMYVVNTNEDSTLNTRTELEEKYKNSPKIWIYKEE